MTRFVAAVAAVVLAAGTAAAQPTVTTGTIYPIEFGKNSARTAQGDYLIPCMLNVTQGDKFVITVEAVGGVEMHIKTDVTSEAGKVVGSSPFMSKKLVWTTPPLPGRLVRIVLQSRQEGQARFLIVKEGEMPPAVAVPAADEVKLLRAEVAAMRAEMAALRAEVLRQQQQLNAMPRPAQPVLPAKP